MTKTFRDPDFGDIEDPAPPDRQDYERVGQQALLALARRRIWPTGSVTDCPKCHKQAFIGREDLTHEVARPGSILVFKHLHGARCEACGAQSLEPNDLITVEREAGVGVHPDYEAKVSRIGTGTIGTYWPKDVVRNLGLEPDTRVFIEVVDSKTALLRFQPPTEKRHAKVRPEEKDRRKPVRKPLAKKVLGKATKEGKRTTGKTPSRR